MPDQINHVLSIKQTNKDLTNQYQGDKKLDIGTDGDVVITEDSTDDEVVITGDSTSGDKTVENKSKSHSIHEDSLKISKETDATKNVSNVVKDVYQNKVIYEDISDDEDLVVVEHNVEIANNNDVKQNKEIVVGAKVIDKTNDVKDEEFNYVTNDKGFNYSLYSSLGLFGLGTAVDSPKETVDSVKANDHNLEAVAPAVPTYNGQMGANNKIANPAFGRRGSNLFTPEDEILCERFSTPPPVNWSQSSDVSQCIPDISQDYPNMSQSAPGISQENYQNMSQSSPLGGLEGSVMAPPCVPGAPPHQHKAENPFQGLFYDRRPGMAAFAFYVEECWASFGGRKMFGALPSEAQLDEFYKQSCQWWIALADEARGIYWSKEMTYYPSPSYWPATPPVAAATMEQEISSSGTPNWNDSALVVKREDLLREALGGSYSNKTRGRGMRGRPRGGRGRSRGRGRGGGSGGMKDPNAPRGNCQAFFYFTKKHRAKLGKKLGDNNPGVVSKELGRMWRELPDGEKLEFLKMAGEDRKRYERELMIYESSGQARAWQQQEEMEKQRVRDEETRKMQDWQKQQLVKAAITGESPPAMAKDPLFGQVPAFTEPTSIQPLASPFIQDYSPFLKGYPQDPVTGAPTGCGVLDDEAAVNKAVTAGTPSLIRVDKQWSGPGSSQTKMSQGLPNRRVRYSPYSPYVKQQQLRRNQKVGSYDVMEPAQQGSWFQDQTQYSCLADKSTDQWTTNPRIKNGDDDLAAITRELGINSELVKELDGNPLAQAFTDQTQELFEELGQMEGDQSEQIANQEQVIEVVD